MKFSYRGFDKSGAPVADTTEGADRHDATEALRKRGIFVTEVSEFRSDQAPRPVPRGRARGTPSRGRRLDDLAIFTRQLSLLVQTGTPLVDAIASLQRQVPPGAWHDVLTTVKARVEEGAQLSEAMAQHPQYFDAVCRSLIAAGEQGGKLDVMLGRLAKLVRQQVKVRKTVTGAMVYPCLLIGVSLVVVTAMLGFVLPRFEGLFTSLDTPLPPTTKYLMIASGVLRTYWWAIVGGLAVLGGGLKVWLSTQAGRQAWDVFTIKAPQLGKVTRSFATARIARMLGVLLEGKVSLLEALTLTRQSMGNSLYIALLNKAEQAVTRGESVSSALADPMLINPAVCEALRSGERTGQVAPVLVSVAEYLDEDNEVLIKTLTGLMEPIILIVLGIIVGVVAISMFLPLFDLTAAGGGA